MGSGARAPRLLTPSFPSVTPHSAPPKHAPQTRGLSIPVTVGGGGVVGRTAQNEDSKVRTGEVKHLLDPNQRGCSAGGRGFGVTDVVHGPVSPAELVSRGSASPAGRRLELIHYKSGHRGHTSKTIAFACCYWFPSVATWFWLRGR